MTKFQKVLSVLFALFLLVIFWRVIIMPYQQANDLRGCIGSGLSTDKVVNSETFNILIKHCETRAKYPSF